MALAKGAIVHEGDKVTLFTQALPDKDLFQFKLHPAEIGAYSDQSRRNPGGTELIIMSQDGTSKHIPLSNIVTHVDPKDPQFGDTTRDENFYGQQTTNPLLGASKTDVISAMVRIPGQTLQGQYNDTGRRWNFLGLVTGGGNRFTEPLNGFTIARLTATVPPSAQTEQQTLLEPLQQQLAAQETLMSGFQALLTDANDKGKNIYWDRPGIKIIVLDISTQLAAAKSHAESLRSQIEDVRAAGVNPHNRNVEPLDAIRHDAYPLENPFPTASADEGIVKWGSTVHLEVTFYARPENLGNGNTINVAIPGTNQFIPFRIFGNKALARIGPEFRLITAYADPSLEDARKLYPRKHSSHNLDVEQSSNPRI